MSSIYTPEDSRLLKDSGRNLVSIGLALGWEARWDTGKRVVTMRSTQHPGKMIRVPVTSINDDRVRSSVHQLITYSDPEKVAELTDAGVDLDRIAPTRGKTPKRTYGTTVAQAMAEAQEKATPTPEPEPEPAWPERTPRPDIVLGHWTELRYEDGRKEWVCDKVEEHRDGKPKTVTSPIAIRGHNNAHRLISEEERERYRVNLVKARAAYAEKHGKKAAWQVHQEEKQEAALHGVAERVEKIEEIVAPEVTTVNVAGQEVRIVEPTPTDASEILAQVVALVAPNVAALEKRLAEVEWERDEWKRKATEIESEWDALRAMIGSK